MMERKAIQAVLNTVTKENMTNGTLSDLWDVLPELVSGSDWVGEVVDCADMISDYISNDEETGEDEIAELAHNYATSETEDYYFNINKRVQALSLWASDELDEEIAEYLHGVPMTIKSLNSLYLYCAMRGLFQTVGNWAIEKAEELAMIQNRGN